MSSTNPQDMGVAAIQLTLQTKAKTAQIKESTASLKTQLVQNQQLLGELDLAIPHSQTLMKELDDKKAELENKRKQLSNLQAALIQQLQNPLPEKKDEIPKSIAVLPIVLGSVLKFFTDLTEAAVNQQDITIPVYSLLKVGESFNRLYSTLIDKGVLHETEEEAKERKSTFLHNQATVLNGLKDIVAAQNVAEEEEEKADNEDDKEVEKTDKKEDEKNENKEEEKKDDTTTESKTEEKKAESVEKPAEPIIVEPEEPAPANSE